MKRTHLYDAGVIVHALNSLFLVMISFPGLIQGPSGHAPTEGVPQVVVVLAGLLGVAGLVSAYGAWYGQKWGVALSVFVEALNGLLAMPGVLHAPTPFLRISAIASVLIALFVIFALLHRPKPAAAQPAAE